MDKKPRPPKPAPPPAGAEEFRELSRNFRVTELAKRLRDLHEDRDFLLEGQKSGNQRTSEFVSYFQSELDKKERIIDRLNETVVKLEVDRDLRIGSVERLCQTKLEAVVSANARERSELESRLSARRAELEGILEFRRQKDAIEAEITGNHARLLALRQSHEDALRQLDRRQAADLARLQQDTERRIAQRMYEVRREAQRGTDADARKIVADNRRMGEELKFLMYQTGDLERLSTSLDGMNGQLRSEVEAYRQKEALYAREGVRKAQLNREAAERKRKVGEDLAAFETRSQTQIDAYRAQHRREATALREKIEKLQSLLRLKNQEISMISSYGQSILDQRTEMEQSFLECLDQVKQELGVRQRIEFQERVEDFTAAMREEADAEMEFPTMRSQRELQERMGAPPPPRAVTLENLTWEDSVRVLRLLFARINAPATSAAAPESPSIRPSSADEAALGTQPSLC